MLSAVKLPLPWYFWDVVWGIQTSLLIVHALSLFINWKSRHELTFFIFNAEPVNDKFAVNLKCSVAAYVKHCIGLKKTFFEWGVRA